MIKAIYPGSFDPFTNGHLDIVKRAIPLCDELIIAVLENQDKQPLFTGQERIDLITRLVPSSVKIVGFRGLVVNLAARLNANCLIRGMRDIGDFRYEWETALVNKSLGDVETLFLMTSPAHSFISSTRIREIARWGGDVSKMVPEVVQSRLKLKYQH